MKKAAPDADFAAAVSTALAGLTTLALVLAFRDQLPLPRPLSSAVGFVVLYAGIGLVVWSAVHLGGGFGGRIAPAHDRLVVTGPYRLVRHPVYLAMTVAMIGAALTTSSLFGLLGALLLFLPVEAHRARLEDRALEEKHGEAWRDYAARVGFMLPRIGRWKSSG